MPVLCILIGAKKLDHVINKIWNFHANFTQVCIHIQRNLIYGHPWDSAILSDLNEGVLALQGAKVLFFALCTNYKGLHKGDRNGKVTLLVR